MLKYESRWAAPVFGLILGSMISPVLRGETVGSAPARPKRVYTNEDLQKFRALRDSGPETQPVQASEPHKNSPAAAGGGTATAPGKPTAASDKSYWSAKLKDADAALQKAKEIEASYIKSLADFQKKHQEAQNEFQKQTAAWQVQDTEKNLARMTANRKKAEESRVAVLQEAAKKGVKEEDLVSP